MLRDPCRSNERGSFDQVQKRDSSLDTIGLQLPSFHAFEWVRLLRVSFKQYLKDCILFMSPLYKVQDSEPSLSRLESRIFLSVE